MIPFESSVKEKDHQTVTREHRHFLTFESSVKEKDHQTVWGDDIEAIGLRAV